MLSSTSVLSNSITSAKMVYSRSARETHWDNVAPRVGFTFLATPLTVIRAGFWHRLHRPVGASPRRSRRHGFRSFQSISQKTQDSVNSTFALSHGPTVASIPLTPSAGLGQSVYTVNRAAGSGYSQQWNLAVQRAIATISRSMLATWARTSFTLAYQTPT